MPGAVQTEKVALVMSGGAFNGAFQLGALRYLNENWTAIFPTRPPMTFDIVTGVSVGALNGVLVASRQFDQLEKLWADVVENGAEEIFVSDYIDTKSKKETLQFKRHMLFRIVWRALFKRKKLVRTKALADNTPLQKKLKQIIDKSRVGMNFKCGLASLTDHGDYLAVGPNDFSTNEDFQDAILASTAMPIIWEPVKKIRLANDQVIHNSLDGGIRTVAPLGDAIKMIHQDPDKASEYTIIIINCCNNRVDPETPCRGHDSNIAQIALRSAVAISQNEIINDDMKWFLKINDIVAQLREAGYKGKIQDFDWLTRKRSHGGLREFKYVLIEPDTGVMGDELVATKGLIRRRIEHGLKKAALAFQDPAQPTK